MADAFRVGALLAALGSVLFTTLNMKAISGRIRREHPDRMGQVRRLWWITFVVVASHICLASEIALRFGSKLTFRTPIYSGLFVLSIFATGSWHADERSILMKSRLKELRGPE